MKRRVLASAALLFDGERIWVAWEDVRSGLEQIRVANAPVSALFGAN